MSRYKAYCEYKDSGVEWLGNIPLNWNVVSIKRQALIFNGATPKSEVSDFWDGDISWITPADLGKDKTPYIKSGTRSITPEGYQSCGTTLVPSNSVILSTRAPIGTLGIAAQELCTNQGCKSLVTSKNLESKFLFYVLLSSTTQLNLLGRGTTFLELSADELGSYKTTFPPSTDQRVIAAFLDHETTKIDVLIEKQQRLIELLKEKRQAVISHAVTKGLNPNAPMKDSGVEWLGEVPAHWGVTKFHYEIDLLEGPGILANDFFDEGVPLLRIQNVKDFFVSDEYKTFLSPSKVDSKWNHFRVASGDLLISCSASTGLVSEVGENTAGAIPYTGLIRLRPQRKAITKDFIRYLVQSDLFFEQINLLQTGSTIQHFGPYHLHQMYITLPPANEQEEIAKVVKQHTNRLDDLIALGNNQIQLMQERRTALISAAVTGKIDVRDWQAVAA